MNIKETTWTDNDLIEAVKISKSYAEVTRRLEVNFPTVYYSKVSKRIKKLKLDISHFYKQKDILANARSKVKLLSNEEFFCVNDIDRSNIKHRIIKYNLIPYQCSECSINSWLNKELSLHLDHINGIPNDNHLNNLRFLCPNCHSQTDTYCGKKLKGRKYIDDKKCLDCESIICRDANRCLTCSFKARNKIEWLPYNDLQKMVDELGYRGAGKKLGVSDNAVKKRLQSHK